YSNAEALDWENTNADGISYLKLPPNTQRTMRYWTDYCGGVAQGCTPAKAEDLRSDINASINGTDGISDGAALFHCTGHVNFSVWADCAFLAECWSGVLDVSSLPSGSKLAWLLVHTCLSAGFMDPNHTTLGEDFVKRSGGGAVAVFAPSGLTDAYHGIDVTDQV